ncbi:MAG TPA: hypothetical protein VHB25_19630 [Gemmatimonadaceae bacterium]|nr:hypothetical protein [Gemmatimonadaceae bacterium]
MNKAIALIAVAALSSACSQKEAAKPDSSAVAQAGSASASQASFDPNTHVAVVHAKDFAFDAPDTVTAGWTQIHLVNDGPSLHHMQLVRLDSGKTVQDLEAALKNPGPPPRWAVFVGGPNAPDPGKTSNATINLETGNYAIICLVDIPDHVPHFAKGMIRPLTVVASKGPGLAEPTPDVTVTLSDYKFDVQGALSAGTHTVKVQNAGPQPHEVEVMRLAPGKTLKDLGAWMDKPNGPPPGEGLGGIDAIVPGVAPAYVSLDLTPGHYAFLCFIPDAKDGKPHLEHGMVKEFDVK